MTISPTTPLILDSNEYIFGLSGDRASCAQLVDRLDNLRGFIPLMVVREVQGNLDNLYGLGNAFFRLIGNQDNITIIWTPPPETLVLIYIDRGFSKEDATIAAAAEQVRPSISFLRIAIFCNTQSRCPFKLLLRKQL